MINLEFWKMRISLKYNLLKYKNGYKIKENAENLYK